LEFGRKKTLMGKGEFTRQKEKRAGRGGVQNVKLVVKKGKRKGMKKSNMARKRKEHGAWSHKAKIGGSGGGSRRRNLGSYNDAEASKKRAHTGGSNAQRRKKRKIPLRQEKKKTDGTEI